MDSEEQRWQEKLAKIEKAKKTYHWACDFLEDMRKGTLIDGFFLFEGAFQEIIGEINADKGIAKEVHNNAIVIVLKADRGQELGGILELAEQIASE